EKAAHIKNLRESEIVIADFNDCNSLEKALKGITHAFLLTDSSAKAEHLQSNFVRVALKVGLDHIVKQSQYKAAVDSPVLFVRYHQAAEEKSADVRSALLAARAVRCRPGRRVRGAGLPDAAALHPSRPDAKASLLRRRDIAPGAAPWPHGTGHYDITHR